MPLIDFSGQPSSVITGTAGADTIYGGFEADTIRGLGGDDSITAGYGSDLIEGGDGNDEIIAQQPEDDYTFFPQADTVRGGAGDDSIVSGYGPNSEAYGDAGNDSLTGGGKLFGGAGDDFYIALSGKAVILDLEGDNHVGRYVWAQGTATYLAASITTGAGNDVIEVGQLVRAGAGNDQIGTAVALFAPGRVNEAYGEDGDDVIYALTASGGSGDDTLYGVNLVGGAGDDTYGINDGSRLDELIDLDGRTTIFAYDTYPFDGFPPRPTHIGRIEVGDGDDNVAMSSDLIIAGRGNDSVSGGAVIQAGEGNDTAEGGTVYGEAGDDVVTASVRGEGGAGDDVLIGTGVLVGGAGRDTYTVTRAVLDYDIIDADDRTIVTGAMWTASRATILTGAAADRIEIGAGLVRSGAGDDTVAGVRHVYGGEGDDSLAGTWVYGEAGDDTITAARGFGDGGDDRIVVLSRFGIGEGGEGNDTLVGRGTLDGGAGDDRYEIVSRLSNDIIDFDGTSVIVGRLNGARSNRVETGAGDDVVRIAAAVVRSNAGADTVTGAAEIYGGDGDDSLDGHRVYGEGGDDIVIAVHGSGGDGDDVVTGRIGAHGGSGNDVLVASKAFGARGNDSIEATIYADGGAGDDVIHGGSRVLGGSGDDTVIGGGSVDLGTGNDSGDGDMVLGNAGNDTVWGRTGADGGAGDDTILFTAGLPTLLTGGEGADAFTLREVAQTRLGVATVSDFEVGVDVVDLTALEWWRSDVTWIRNGDDIAIRDGERVTILILETDDGAAFDDLSILV